MQASEVIEKLAAIQNPIWQTASTTVSEAANQTIMFSSPLTVAARTADLYSELSTPMMVVQFAFASQPDNPQVILVPQETVLSMVELIQGSQVDEIDENIVSELRASMEAIVQGICLGVGAARSEMIVASGLSIRFQIFAFPHNLQRSDTVVRTQIAVTGEDLNGSIIWLMDNQTAALIIGVEGFDGVENPFPNLKDSSGGGGGRPGYVEEGNSLDRLLDIPLEISVELGRVRMLVKDVLDLGNGSILEIDKSAGEPVDVLVNGRLVARGEVVVIEDNFGVRITEIVNPNERLMRSNEVA